MEVSTHFGLGVLAHFKPKKTDKIYKDFELSQVFTCQTVLIFRNTYILFRKKFNTFWSGRISTCWCGIISTFWPKKSEET